MAFVTDEDIPYTSNAVEDIAYDAAKRELFVAFHNQPIEWFTMDDGTRVRARISGYIYENVDRELYDKIMSDPSKGRAVNWHLVHADPNKHPYRTVLHEER